MSRRFVEIVLLVLLEGSLKDILCTMPQPKLRGELISEGTPQRASALDEVFHESSVRYAFCGARAR